MEKEVCSCDDFKEALKRGTDNEGFGRLFEVEELGYDEEFHTNPLSWAVGMYLQPPRFCPWCGKSLPKPYRTER